MTGTLMRKLRRLTRSAREDPAPILESHLEDETVAQKALMQQYRLLASFGTDRLPALADVGFRKYSQFEGWDLALHLFAGSSRQPDVRRNCAGDGRECNTANLIINHGWWGHLFDGDERNVRVGRAFFARHKDTFLHPHVLPKPGSPPSMSTIWSLSPERKGLLTCSVSILDGMDYWVWKAITVIEPQVVICETHNPIPPDLALTVPYDPQFVCQSENYYRGASLAAMCKLGRDKGYRLVGAHRFGFNALFLKNGVGEQFFPEVDAASCVQDPFSELARRERWPLAKQFNWQKV